LTFTTLQNLRSSDLGNNDSLVQPAKVDVLSDRTIEEWCAYCIEQSENWFNVPTQSYIFFLGVLVFLRIVPEVLHESIRRKKEKWPLMIIECTDKREASIRWENQIDKLMWKYVVL